MTEQKELVPYETLSLQDTERLGKLLVASGRFKDAESISKAVVQVLAGRELGFGPIASMTGIYVIKGKVSVGANMMAQAVKRSAKYDYRINLMNAEVCEIIYYEQGKEIGRSRFDKADATRAGTQNMGKFPRNMMFARAMSNGVKWYCPDVFQTGVYTPEELGAEVDGTGEIVEGAFKVEKKPESTPTPPPAKLETITPPITDKQPEQESEILPQTDKPNNGSHWIDKPKVRAGWFAWLKDEGVTKEKACEILQVDSMHDYTGHLGEAKMAIMGWKKQNA